MQRVPFRVLHVCVHLVISALDVVDAADTVAIVIMDHNDHVLLRQ